MLQINDGNGWHEVFAYESDLPSDLLDKRAFQILDDPHLPGFSACMKLSSARGHALFRLGNEGAGDLCWVEVGNMPYLMIDRMMTVMLTLTPADLSDEK